MRSAIILLLVWWACFLPEDATAQETVFEVEKLNAGLPVRPDGLDILTPQTALETFLSAADRNDFDTARHVLNLNGIDPSVQAIRGNDLARKLDAIIDRKLVISWQALLERPDSLDANAPSENVMAGQPRRSLLLGVLELSDRPVAVRLNRVQPADGPAVWLFSRQTVDVIDPLFDRFGPSALEQALPEAIRAKGPLGLFWWEVIGIPVLVIAAGAIGLAVWSGFTRIGQRVGHSFAAGVVRGLRLPMTLFVVAGLVWASTSYVFIVSGLLSNILEPFVVLAFVGGVLAMIVNVIDAALDRIMIARVEELSSPENENRRAYATTILALRRLVVVIAVIAAVGITLTVANVFQTLGFSLLAGAGALTLVLGFAAREALGNILGSLQISLNRSARVGDQLIFRDTLCTVERIQFTFVQLKVWDDTRLIVPVLDFIKNSFVNRTLVDNGMTRQVVLTLSPRADVEALRVHYLDWAKADPRIGPDDGLECYVIGQDEFGMKVRFLAPVSDPRDGWDVECAMREEMITAARGLSDDTGLDHLPHLGTADDGEGAFSADSDTA